MAQRPNRYDPHNSDEPTPGKTKLDDPVVVFRTSQALVDEEGETILASELAAERADLVRREYNGDACIFEYDGTQSKLGRLQLFLKFGVYEHISYDPDRDYDKLRDKSYHGNEPITNYELWAKSQQALAKPKKKK